MKYLVELAEITIDARVLAVGDDVEVPLRKILGGVHIPPKRSVFADDSFDSVVIGKLLDSTQLKEAHRILKNGGKLAVKFSAKQLYSENIRDLVSNAGFTSIVMETKTKARVKTVYLVGIK